MSTPDPAPLRRLARRVRVRALVTSGGRRVVESLPAALQITVAVVVSYSIARFLFGHQTPLIAVTVTITTLGLSRDARPRGVLETSIGVSIGIALSEVIVIALGKGPWQMAIVLFATLIVARAVSSNPAFAIAAAVQGMIVVLLPDPPGGVFTRSIDALIAGAVALAATALIPRDPRSAATRDARVLFSVFKESLDGLVEGVARADHSATELALERLRRTQGMIDHWSSSLESATAISRISPWLRRQLPELAMQARVLKAADLTSRHLRSIARRVTVLVEDGTPRPELAALLAELAGGIHLLGQQVEDRDLTGASRSVFEDLARRLDPTVVVPDGSLREQVVVVLMRPLVVDLLAATGTSADAARALLPPVDD